jgi:hypothetical protein
MPPTNAAACVASPGLDAFGHSREDMILQAGTALDQRHFHRALDGFDPVDSLGGIHKGRAGKPRLQTSDERMR